MKFTLVNETNWNKVFIKILDKDRKEIINNELELVNNKIDIELDSKVSKLISFNNGENESTEIIYISENINQIALRYNEIRKEVDAYFVNPNVKYNSVLNFTLEDEKNLYFRSDKKKNIHVLLPDNFDSNKEYGMLLMFDGQNIFDKTNVGNYTLLNDPYGSWQIDVSLTNIKKHFGIEYIVVGLEDADNYRPNELMPSSNFGSFKTDEFFSDDAYTGHLEDYDNFINETVFPFIESKYKINKDYIGISGSSCGGAACHYVGLKNLGKYKFILCYTPASALYLDSAWIKFYEELDFKKNYNKLPIFYYFQGQKDDLEKLLYENNLNLIPSLINAGYNKDLIKSLIEPTAYHNETAWRFAFNYMIYKTHELLIKRD